MSEFQVLTLVATLLGITATALNLVAFVREKDKSHTRAGILFLFLLVMLLGVFFLPRYAPNAARRLASGMPASVARTLGPWLDSSSSQSASLATSNSPVAESAVPAVLGSFTIEIDRNLLGGIGALVSDFRFSNSSGQAVRVSAYHLKLTPQVGDTARNYDRVLEEPMSLEPGASGQTQVELDAEIRDQWVAREKLEPGVRGPIEITWEFQDAEGRLFRVTSSNG